MKSRQQILFSASLGRLATLLVVRFALPLFSPNPNGDGNYGNQDNDFTHWSQGLRLIDFVRYFFSVTGLLTTFTGPGSAGAEGAMEGLAAFFNATEALIKSQVR